MKRVLIAAVLLATAAALYIALQPAPDRPVAATLDQDRAAQVARGEYLARAGNCMACHTAPGGTFATYTAAGHVRRALAAAGFTVTRQPGFARKRHMTTGQLHGAGHL